MNTTTKVLLTEAKRLITDIGFCKGRLKYIDDDNNAIAYCMMGAIEESCKRYNELSHEPFYKCQDALKLAIGDNHVVIANWNDEAARTKSDVISVFSKAIASCD